MENLLPCPFCGTSNPSINDIEFTAEVQCSGDDCNAKVSAMIEDDAIKLWNRRPTKLAHDAGESTDLQAVSNASAESTSQKSDALTQRV